MALISCPECQKKISSRAEACPECGCPVPIACEKGKVLVIIDDTPIKGILSGSAIFQRQSPSIDGPWLIDSDGAISLDCPNDQISEMDLEDFQSALKEAIDTRTKRIELNQSKDSNYWGKVGAIQRNQIHQQLLVF